MNPMLEIFMKYSKYLLFLSAALAPAFISATETAQNQNITENINTETATSTGTPATTDIKQNIQPQVPAPAAPVKPQAPAPAPVPTTPLPVPAVVKPDPAAAKPTDGVVDALLKPAAPQPSAPKAATTPLKEKFSTLRTDAGNAAKSLGELFDTLVTDHPRRALACAFLIGSAVGAYFYSKSEAPNGNY
jgi:hypothetical protein